LAPPSPFPDSRSQTATLHIWNGPPSPFVLTRVLRTDDVRNAARAHRHDGQLRGHRLQHHEAQRLALAGHYEHVRGGVGGGQVLALRRTNHQPPRALSAQLLPTQVGMGQAKLSLSFEKAFALFFGHFGRIQSSPVQSTKQVLLFCRVLRLAAQINMPRRHGRFAARSPPMLVAAASGRPWPRRYETRTAAPVPYLDVVQIGSHDTLTTCAPSCGVGTIPPWILEADGL
jgi:hypothetical protein